MSSLKPKQWRSLRELERDPAFLARAAREFPMLREAIADPQGRRQMLRLMAAAFALGGLGGCDTGSPSGVLIPAVRTPPDIIPGQPNHYATAHVSSGYALGTVVTHQMGRPIKVEGNPLHPSSLGSTDAFAQAEVLSFYDPDRDMTIGFKGVPSDRQALLTAITDARQRIAADHGGGFRILTGTVTSPTIARQLDKLLTTYPEARWHQWEAINRDNVLKGTIAAYGRPLDIVPQLGGADVILGLDSDLLESVPGWVRYARDYAGRRNPSRVAKMSRVYAVESVPSLLGAVADQRLTVGPREMHQVIAALAAAILHGAPPADGPAWLRPVMDDLKGNNGRAFIHLGAGQPPEAHTLVQAMNEALGGRGHTFRVIEPVAHDPQPQSESLVALVEEIQAGKVHTLLMLDCNPVFTAPGTLGFGRALNRVDTSFALTSERNETAQAATWAVPMAHPWETWGDARGHDGTASILQPQSLPLYGGLAVTELIARFGELFPPPALQMVQDTWRDSLGADFHKGWHDALASGVVPDTASAAATVQLRANAAGTTPADPPPGGLTVLFRPDHSLWDGRYANNPWLQELPHPLTKLTWDNPLLIAPELARKLHLQNGDHALLAIGARQIPVPVWIQPGQAPDVVVAWIGNGRHVVGEVGSGAGFDYYPMMGSGSTATLTRARGHTELASTDHHHVLFDHADDIVRHATLAEFHSNPRFAKRPEQPELYFRKPTGPAAWAMAVDLNACIGCNACVIACQAENNVPVVGKQQVEREREMHWLRIDRYYEGTPEDPQAFFQPMFCQMCEKAPCELVCPVGATVHDSEGINAMVYNRCIGTRFCSNNCPYKVRRFNFYGYGNEQHRPAVSWNPNVTVRGRGVMEKCTYCLQRIAEARITADRENRRVAPQEVRTACQAACPTQAFTFGDLSQPDSDVAKRKQSPLDYAVLDDQHTHPRTTYEAVVRNPNPRIRETSA